MTEETTFDENAEALGDALDSIIVEAEKQVPYVFENYFIENIIPLLVRPWDEDNLNKYRNYVREFSNELRVISYEETPRVLFHVPALYPRPFTSVVSDDNNATVTNLIEYLHNERGRSPFPQDHILTDFITKISIRESVEESTLIPLIKILAHYDRALEDDNGNPLYDLKEIQGKPTEEKSLTTTASDSEETITDSYTDEYDD